MAAVNNRHGRQIMNRTRATDITIFIVLIKYYTFKRNFGSANRIYNLVKIILVKNLSSIYTKPIQLFPSDPLLYPRPKRARKINEKECDSTPSSGVCT
jgi:hypothetical protein